MEDTVLREEPRDADKSLSTVWFLIMSLTAFGCGSAAAGSVQGPVDSPAQGTPERSDAPRSSETSSKPVHAALSEKTSRAIVDSHNRFRRDHCAPPLTWSDALASSAQSWADTLKADGCALAHSTDNGYGENLFFGGPPGAFELLGAVDTWYSEVKHYDYGSPGFSMQTGHFTQVVWRGTKEVGCGAATCVGGDIVVCNYYPAGNVQNEFKTNVYETSRCGRN